MAGRGTGHKEVPAMRLPRMTTRRWMIAVAVVGIVLAGVEGG